MTKLSFTSLYSASQISQQDAKMIFDLAKQYKQTLRSGQKVAKTLEDKIIATLFFEPSTRTRLSFESAAIRLGAKIIHDHGKDSSSLAKGESMAHTAKVMSNYCDLTVVRHSDKDGVEEFIKNSKIHVINAGNGDYEHPTQALVDAFTIYENFGRLNDLTIAFCGDLKNNRTILSLKTLLYTFNGNKFIDLDYATHIDFTKINNRNEFCKIGLIGILNKMTIEQNTDIDVGYFVRTQNLQMINKVMHSEIISDLLKNRVNKHQRIIMHPLPIADEIGEYYDKYQQVKYFEQAENGLYIRMALLDLMLNN
jgi:aspartate carbamoyltransferase catalytic subunit